MMSYPYWNVTKKNPTELFPDAKISRSMEQLLEMDEVELVIITTPNSSHFSYAKQALQAGKHVVVDKPFTIESSEAKELIDIAKEMGKVVSVYQNRRYDSDFLTIQEILAENTLGNILEFEAHYDRFVPQIKQNAWREESLPGCGMLFDLGSHLIDQAFCLFGLPHTITADLRSQRPHAKTDDYFDIRLDYGHMRVLLKCSMLVLEFGPRYTIHGDKGSYIKFGIDPQEKHLRSNELPNQDSNWGAEDEKDYGQITTESLGKIHRHIKKSKNGNYGLYYENLYLAIREGLELREKPEHGYNTIRAIELAKISNIRKATVACDYFMTVDYPKSSRF